MSKNSKETTTRLVWQNGVALPPWNISRTSPRVRDANSQNARVQAQSSVQGTYLLWLLHAENSFDIQVQTQTHKPSAMVRISFKFKTLLVCRRIDALGNATLAVPADVAATKHQKTWAPQPLQSFGRLDISSVVKKGAAGRCREDRS